MRDVLTSQVLPAPRFRYTPVVRAHGWVFISGLVGIDPQRGALVEGSYEQTRQVLANLAALCDEQGWSLDQLVMGRVYVSASASPADVNRAWDEAFATVVPPARSFVTVQSLPLGAAVEIEFQLAS